LKHVLLCALLSAAMAQTAAAPVPISKEGHHHLVLDNEYVRVYEVEVAPHEETLYHQHDLDYIFVTLGDSVVENDRVGEKPAKLELKDGDTRFTRGGFAHKAVNLSDKPFRNVTVELKKGAGTNHCGQECTEDVEEPCQFYTPLPSARPQLDPDCKYKTINHLLFNGSNSFVRTLEIGSHGFASFSGKRKLLISMQDCIAEIGTNKRGLERRHFRAGETQWFPVDLLIIQHAKPYSKFVVVGFE
jgi:quercetin dioxygenase-like cupin family protein